jgi:hypothetical protein
MIFARLARITLASAAAVGAARGLWTILGGAWGRTASLLACIALAGVLYAVFCQLLRVREWQAARAKLRR